MRNNICSNDADHTNQYVQMMPIIQINFLSYKTEAGKNRVGSKQERTRERKREADYGSERRSVGENQK